jgi:hypothetical protein
MRRLLLVVPVILFSAKVCANMPPRPPPRPEPATNPTVNFNFEPITVGDPDSTMRLGPPRLPGEPYVPAQPSADAASVSRTHTVIAGLAISAAITAAGLTLARRGKSRA